MNSSDPTVIQSTQEQPNNNALTNQPSLSRKWWAMLCMGLGIFMFTVDIFIVNLALPTLVRSLHTSRPSLTITG